jgi:hypothetical protein
MQRTRMAPLRADGPAAAQGDDQGEISLWLRIGVLGHRNIRPDHPGLIDAINAVLAAVNYELAALRVLPTRVCLAAVSSLAEGADRILAREILAREADLGWDTRLEAILPLDKENYREDFGSAESREEFDHLLDGAIVDVIGPAESRKHSYEAAGQAVVDRSDLVIVLWDGKPARGRGGTAEIRTYALRRNKPVFWIRVDRDSAVLAERPADLGASHLMLSPDAWRRIDRYNSLSLRPGTFAEVPKALTHLGESAPGHAGSTAEMLVQHVWRYFVRADAVAGKFQTLWMWLTRLLYALAAIAVALVAAQVLFFPHHERYAWSEFGTLVAVTVIVLVARFSHWHERWISARYLAEQIRSLVFLGLAGVVTYDDVSAGHGAELAGESRWTERAVAEVWWSRPRNDLRDEPGVLRHVLEEGWIVDQLNYHLSTCEKYGRRSRRFTVAAVGLFTLSAVAALLHSLGAEPHVLPAGLLSFLSIVIPAVGAAISGYAAQRDYARHSERSLRFAAELTEARRQLRDAKDVAGIQQVVLSISRLMRGEATDWYAVVRSQELQP